VSVRTYVRNGGRGQLSSERRHSENDVVMRTGAASAVGVRFRAVVRARRHIENDVTMTIAGLYGDVGDWQHVATDCTALVVIIFALLVWHQFVHSEEDNQST